MPVTRIAIRDGKAPEYKQALMDEIYTAMRETVAIKEGDRFMAISDTMRASSHTDRFSGSSAATTLSRSRSSGRPARRSRPTSGCTGRLSTVSGPTQAYGPRMC
jgi:hypothetical protein